MTDLRTYRDTPGLMGPVDVRDDRPDWADYAIGEPIAFRSNHNGVVSAPVAGYSIRDEYRGLPCVWTPSALAGEVDAPLLAITDARHVPREDAPGGNDSDLQTDGGSTRERPADMPFRLPCQEDDDDD